MSLAPADEGNGRTARWDLIAFLGISVFAFAVRLVYLFQIEAIPLFHHPAFDGRVYDEWAQRIAAGDWLGEGVFFQAPLYPYFLAVLQTCFGHDLWSIRVVQIVLGSLSCGLLCLATRATFGRAAGLVAGALLAVYAPALFFDGLLQKTNLDLFLICTLLFLLSRPSLRPGRLCASGVVLGLLALTRENAMIWAPVVLVWTLWCANQGERLLRAGAFVLGMTVVLLPVGLRNLVVGGELALTTSQFGLNFYLGNNPTADGTYEPLSAGWGSPELEQQEIRRLAEVAEGRSLSPAEVSDYWLGLSLDYISAEPVAWLSLLGKKWLMFWNVREIEDADDYYLYQEWSPTLRLLARVFHFGVLAPLAALGILLTARRWRELSLLYALLFTMAASVAVFYVVGRYRFPIVPLLAPFAAAGLVEGVRLIREREVKRLLVGVVGCAVAAVLVRLPVIDKPSPTSAGLNNLAVAYAKDGRFDEAVRTYERTLEVHPLSASTHYNLGSLLADRNQLGEAEEHLRRAIEIQPEYAEAHNNLGTVLGRRGNRPAAILEFRRATELKPRFLDARLNLAMALMRSGDPAGARRELETALEAHPDADDARALLERLERAEGARPEEEGE